jgi:indole-3-glycerol phosphate synthase/phosphoribosylanthranilate isomerase
VESAVSDTKVRFAQAIGAPGFGAIAEFKRRSPSAGDLRPDGDVVEVARQYERAGARAMSVLVDERFAGSWDDLRAARTATTLPLLAKGFFSTPGHLQTAREAGADAALLILRDLDDETCAMLMREAQAIGLDTLVEAHDAEELDRAAALDAPVIGLNARDLSTFAIDRHAQLALLARAPRDRIVVAESAIATRAQGAAAELTGAKAVLVGSTLMRAPDPGAKLAELISRPLVKVCGLTRQEDVDVAVEAGADLVGFILAQESPRRSDELLDAPETVLRVAVFVGDEHETDADLVQFYGRVDGHRSRDAVLKRDGEEVGAVLDLPWLADDPEHLARARAHGGRVMLAGGLDAANVGEAIAAVHPWAVDSARSTEREPGIKDHDAVRAWLAAAAKRPLPDSGPVEGARAKL